MNLSHDNIKYLCELLLNNHTIKQIDLSNNDLSDKCIEEFLHLLDHNKFLNTINLDNNKKLNEDLKVKLYLKLLDNVINLILLLLFCLLIFNITYFLEINK